MGMMGSMGMMKIISPMLPINPINQMIQSARSGKQNILEGSKAGTTSKETETKLTNVGRASLEELLADYRDYLRVRDLPLWDKDSKEALFVRELGRNPTARQRSTCTAPA